MSCFSPFCGCILQSWPPSHSNSCRDAPHRLRCLLYLGSKVGDQDDGSSKLLLTTWHGRAEARKAWQPESLWQRGLGAENSGSDLNAPCWIRTSDRLLRRQLLYPAELREPGAAIGRGWAC